MLGVVDIFLNILIKIPSKIIKLIDKIKNLINKN
jgi:hypothetical protein